MFSVKIQKRLWVGFESGNSTISESLLSMTDYCSIIRTHIKKNFNRILPRLTQAFDVKERVIAIPISTDDAAASSLVQERA